MTRRTTYRFWMYMLLLTVSLAVLVLPTEGAGYSFENGYVQKVPDIETLRESLGEPVDPFQHRWEFRGDTGRIIKMDAGNGFVFLQTDGPNTANIRGFMGFAYLDKTDLSGHSALAFGLHITDTYLSPDPEEMTDQLPAGLYRVTMTVRAGMEAQSACVYVESGEWNLVHCDLPLLKDMEKTESLEIRVEYNPAYPPEQLEITPPSAVKNSRYNSSAFAAQFSAAELHAVAGMSASARQWVNMLPDENGLVTVEAKTVLTRYASVPQKRYLAVTADSTAASGTVMASVLYAGETFWLDSLPLDILPGTHTYYIPLPILTGTGAEQPKGGQYDTGEGKELAAYRLAFRNVHGEITDHFRITGVEFLESDVLAWRAGNLGSVTESTVRDGNLVYSGKLNRQAVIDYIDSRVVLRAVPVWAPYALENGVTLAQVRVANTFSFAIPMTDAEIYAGGWLFYAAILLPDGTELPISQPPMLAGADPAACNLSLFGVHGANAVGVFESNVSHVTVDVKLDALILPPGSTGVICTLGGVSCQLSPGVLAALDSEIHFYTNAGMEVCLRIDADAPFVCSDKTAASYLPLSESETVVREYSAVLAYLCRRYPDIASIALGSGINCEKYTGISLADPVAAMEKAAVLTALTYQVARLSIPDVYVVVPLSDGYIYANESALPDSGTVLEPELAAVMFADALQTYGKIPYVLSYTFESDDVVRTAETAALTARLKRVLQQLGLPLFGDLMYLWEPESCLRSEPIPYNLAERYQILCHTLAAGNRNLNTRAVTLSLARIADHVSQAMYADIQQITDPDGTSLRQVLDCGVTLYGGEYRLGDYLAAVSIWDFSDAYQIEGFVPSQGISTLQTAYSPLLSADGSYRRVLRSQVPVMLYEDSPVGMAGGILLRNFAVPVDFTKMDKLSFTFTLSRDGNSAAPVKLVFLLGADDWRAEYVVTDVEPGKVMTAVCDLAAYEPAARTEYIGVMLYGESSLTFDLSSVHGYSSTSTEEELAALFRPAAEETETGRIVEMFYLLVLMTAVSVCVFVLLLRWEREEEARHEAEHAGK